MSRIFMDGFESGNMDLWTYSFGTMWPINSTKAGRQGAYCTGIGSSGGIQLAFNNSELYLALKICVTGGYVALRFLNGGTELGYLYPILTFPQFYWGGYPSSGTLVSGSSIGLTADPTWYLLELRYKPHLTAGVVQLKINGILAIDVQTGKTAVSTSNITAIMFNVGSSGTFFVDDVIVDDANWIGSTSIQGLVPTGAGATTQFDPSIGSNYACVDEIPPSDTDYVSTNTPDEIDTYACGNLTGTINSVKAVQVRARCMQEGSPAVPKIQLVTRPTSTDRVSASKSVQTFQPGMVSNIWELNPDDSAAWAEADVNGMEIGVKAVAL